MKKKIRLKYAHDTREGWAVVSYYLGNELIAEDDGNHTTFYGDKEKSEKIVTEYWERNGHPEPDWESYEKDLIEDQALQIKEDYGELWVIIENHYASQTSPGFSNTFYIDDAEPGQRSKYGWEEAIQVKDVPEEFHPELVLWAKNSELDTIIYWFD